MYNQASQKGDKMQIENSMCASCEKAHDMRDSGFPEEVFYHCYSDNCSCGCSSRKEEALKFCKEFYFKGLKSHLVSKIRDIQGN